MKISKGRGIKFFKLPVMPEPKKFVVNTFNSGKHGVKNAINGVAEMSNNFFKNKKGPKK